MALKRIRNLSQAADLYATIHRSRASGHSLEGAIAQARGRYPSMSPSIISTVASTTYSKLDKLEQFFGGNLGQFSNPLKHFGCTGNQIRFTTYSQFIDATTGQKKEFWIDTTLTILEVPVNKSSLVWLLYNEGVLAAKNQGYNPRPLIEGATATEMMVSGTLKVTGYECVD